MIAGKVLIQIRTYTPVLEALCIKPRIEQAIFAKISSVAVIQRLLSVLKDWLQDSQMIWNSWNKPGTTLIYDGTDLNGTKQLVFH